VRGVVLFIL